MSEVIERANSASEPDPPASAPRDNTPGEEPTNQPSRPENGGKIGRRGLVAASAAGAVALAVRAFTGAHKTSASNRMQSSGKPAPAPLPAQAKQVGSWASPELRLVRRVTMGLTEAEANRAQKMGYDAYLEYQLNYSQIDDTAVEDTLDRSLPTLSMSYPDLWAMAKTAPLRIYSELVEATFRRSVHSNRQLYQRMVEFWSDHFNLTFYKVPFSLTRHDRDVIRTYALDTFPNLLRATAHSPAMMRYLDNADAQKNEPNQNYARELMELMTLGVDGGYTQQDVIEVSRCFTGWSLNELDPDPAQLTISQSSAAPEKGAFQYKPSTHDDGEKTVLGQTIPAGGGISDGETVLDMLARHPNTARHIARKLCAWLLQHNPPQSIVDRVAQTYLTTSGDIKAMIRVILQKPNVVASPPKYKRPFHLIVSTVRAADVSLAPGLSKRGWLGEKPFQWPKGAGWLGQAPFEWPEPNGYPDSLNYWAGLLLPRCNFGGWLVGNQLAGLTCDVSRLVKAGTPEAVVQTLDRMLFAGEMPAQERNDLLEFVRKTGQNPINEDAARRTLALALALPAFQWY